jgi:hypothetical protein
VLGAREVSWTWLRHFEDKATVDVVERADGLEYRSQVARSIWGALAVITFLVIWTVGAFRTGWGWRGLAFGAIAFGWYGWRWFEAVDVSLWVSTSSLEAIGNFGGGYEPVRMLRWAEVIRLEFRPGTDGEDQYTPKGLWAVTPGGASCLLPGLSQEQADPIVDQIYRKFPDVSMAKDSEYRGLFKDDLISLGLSRSE